MPSFAAASSRWSNRSPREKGPTAAKPASGGFRREPKRANVRRAYSIDPNLMTNAMLKTANPFDSTTTLDGIRRWVEIETPTDAPAQVNTLATMVADGYRNLPVSIERIPGHSGCGD